MILGSNSNIEMKKFIGFRHRSLDYIYTSLNFFIIIIFFFFFCYKKQRILLEVKENKIQIIIYLSTSAHNKNHSWHQRDYLCMNLKSIEAWYLIVGTR